MSHSEESSKPNQEFQPLHNICEFLTAIHIYADEARQGKTRWVPANHYCSHVREDLRQCLIYDSSKKDARLIGIEYMIPKAKYLTLPADEQKLWHSHEFEVKSGMLILPKPVGKEHDEWEKVELEAMQGIMNLYGKTWHTWQVDRDDELPLGRPVLMGSATHAGQVDLDGAMKERNREHGVHHGEKAKARAGLTHPGIPENADSWWKS